jgi:hypothetical protein
MTGTRSAKPEGSWTSSSRASHVVRKARNDRASKGQSCGQSTTKAGECVSCHRIAQGKSREGRSERRSRCELRHCAGAEAIITGDKHLLRNIFKQSPGRGSVEYPEGTGGSCADRKRLPPEHWIPFVCPWSARLSRKGALQIPPLRYASVGMTRVERLLFGRVATWMEGVRNCADRRSLHFAALRSG